jgi:hypothetical protein
VRDHLRRSLAVLEASSLLAVILYVTIVALSSGDLTFHDETAYLSRGLAIGDGEFPDFLNGAAYSQVYFVASQLITDNANLYFCMRLISAQALVLGVWLAVRLVATPLIAWMTAALLSLLALTYAWPGVSGPAGGLAALSVAIVMRWRTPGVFGIAAGLMWLASAFRPELVWFACLASVLALARLLWPSASSRSGESRFYSCSWGQTVSVLAGGLLVPSLLVAFYGSPFSSDSRSWVAFAQHFSLRNAKGGEDPWLQASDITSRFFGDATSVASAFFAAPAVFAKHMLENIVYSYKDLALALGGTVDHPVSAGGVLVSAFGVVTLAVVFRRILGRSRARTFPSVERVFVVAFTGGLLVALIAPIVILYPRQHYLVPLAAVMFVLGALMVTRDHRSDQISTIGAVAVLVVFSWTAILVAVSVSMGQADRKPLLQAVRQLQELDQELVLLSEDWGLDVYVPGMRLAPSFDPKLHKSLGEWIDATHTNVVLLNDRLSMAPIAGAPDFDGFRDDPSSLGFVPLAQGSNLWVRPPQQ